jgi:hypothetical protein
MTAEELLAAFAGELDESPWLRAFVSDGDTSLDEAERRWRDAVAAAKVELRAKGVELHRRMTTRHGLQTTCLAMTTEES